MAYTRTYPLDHSTPVAEGYWKGCLKVEASGPFKPATAERLQHSAVLMPCWLVLILLTNDF